MSEQIRDCVGYEGLYAVTDTGRVWAYPKLSRNRGRWLKIQISRCGYPTVIMYKNGITKTKTVHRLVALAFLGVAPKGYQVNHINGIKSDNRLINLEWCTAQENRKHAWKIGLSQASARARSAASSNMAAQNVLRRKLADCTDRVIDLRRNGISQEQTAHYFGVGRSVIKRIDRESRRVT